MSVFAEHLQIRHGTLAVAVVELIRDVPTERTKLLALLDYGVEHANAEYHRTPVLPQNYYENAMISLFLMNKVTLRVSKKNCSPIKLTVVFKKVIFHFDKRSLHIRFESFGRFVCYFH